MGYTTRFLGEITITPPIPWGQIKDSPFLPDNAQSREGRDVMFKLDEQSVETDEGVLHRSSAVAVVSTWEDEARGYNIVDHLQQVVNAHPDHEFGGRLDCYGEETGDLWRLEVQGRRAIQVKPRIIWPDGTEEPQR